MAKKPTKPRPKKAAKRCRHVGAGKDTERVVRPELQAAGAGSQAPQSPPPPRVSWRDDSHAEKVRAPKRVQQRIELIAKWVWRSIPDREQKVIGFARHDILLMSGPVVERLPDRPLDEISKLARWDVVLGILLDVEDEASDPNAENRFLFLIAHELAHAYVHAASGLINAGAGLLPGTGSVPEIQLTALQAIADAHGPLSRQDGDGVELLVTALAISWGFGDGYLACWMLDRQLKGLSGKEADPAGALALVTRHAR